MTSSKKTVQQILAVLRRHLDRSTIRGILKDLQEVEGNQSVKNTIQALWREVE